MRVHAIPHPTGDGRYLINYDRKCNKPSRWCKIPHLNVFTDDELANHEIYLAAISLDEKEEV